MALSGADGGLHNIPTELTSFIGRERELRQVRGFLARTRLLTLTGAGGCGKSRLARRIAAIVLSNFPDGVWVAELASLADPALVPHSVASVLKVPDQAGRRPVETLIEALQSRSFLLVLDNCEHLQEACTGLAQELLHGCTHLRILATSRTPLNLPGETLWRVPSLSLPEGSHAASVEEIGQSEAVRLFVERAQASDPRVALTRDNAASVARLCRRLDGMPLAIELAAARTNVLSVEQIGARLDDRFRLLTGGSAAALPRHRTLRATMDWSYGLLAERERMVLGRLSVFAGGWTLEAAEAVCAGDGVEPADVLDSLSRLVDSSLVTTDTQYGAVRYRTLETVRQYGRGRLAETTDDARVRCLHLDWYLQLAERADARLRGPEEAAWLRCLEVEHDNLRAALEWSKEVQDGSETELRLAGALEWFWYLRGHWSEGRTRLENAITRSADASPFLPKVLVGAGRLAYRQSDRERAKHLFVTGLALSQELGHKAGMGWFLVWLGIMATTDADYQQAEHLLEESLAVNRELGDKWWTSQSLAFLGNLSAMQGGYETAVARNLESLALSRETGSINNITFALRNLGLLALRRADFERAAACYTESLIISKEAGYAWVIAECLEGLARVACGRAEHQRAARLFGAAEASFENLGAPIQDFHILKRIEPQLRGQPAPLVHSDHDRYVALTRTGLGEADFAAEWRKGRAMKLVQAIDYALAVTAGTPLPAPAVAPTGEGKPGPLTAREQEVAALAWIAIAGRDLTAKVRFAEDCGPGHLLRLADL
jgi:predicted ATPase